MMKKEGKLFFKIRNNFRKNHSAVLIELHCLSEDN